MATDLSTGKPVVGAVFPPQVTDSPQFRLEPLITPQQLKTRHLFGIPLVSFIKDPETGKYDRMTDEQLKDIIQGALMTAEIDAHIDIMPVQRSEKHPWDRNDYMAMGYFRTEHRPVAVLQAIEVSPPDNSSIFKVPLEWVEVARLAFGQINIIPLLVAMTSNGGVVSATTAGAAVFLAIFSDRHWLPDFWRLTYVSGFPDGMVPRIVNELIGTIATLEILSMLGATVGHVTSVSLGIDALSQSMGLNPQRFKLRLDELAEKRKMLKNKIKTIYGQKLFSGQV